MLIALIRAARTEAMRYAIFIEKIAEIADTDHQCGATQ
jgi:hypothetical protein